MPYARRFFPIRIAQLALALIPVCQPGPLAAQADEPRQGESTTAAGAAADAFGEQVGTERIGLYNVNQTRGFDLLASSGAFRLDGAYYFPAEIPGESLLSGSSIRVGAGAAGIELPSPTGVILYRLREPGPDNALTVTAGLRTFLSPAVSAEAHWRALPSVGLLGHVLIEPDNRAATGEPGEFKSAALVAQWQPFDGAEVKAFGSWVERESEGSIAVLSAGSKSPLPIVMGKRYGPAWLRSAGSGSNKGIIADYSAGRWEAGFSAVRSDQSNAISETAVLDLADDGTMQSTIVRTPPGSSRSDTLEARVARSFEALGAVHRIGAAARARRSETWRSESVLMPGGSFTIETGAAPVAEPRPLAPTRRARDRIDQRLLSLTYGLAVPNRVELRLGAHANRHAKEAESFDGLESRTVENDWLLNASLVVTASQRLKLFASYATGLEESGVAPSAALNRGEVLPPVTAEQIELGGTYRVGRDLSLILAAFDISKPTFGLRPDNVFGPTGTVRHRGIEGSIVGEIVPGTRIVLGANLVDPVLSRDGTDLTAPGVSRFNAILGFEQQVAEGLSCDGNLYFEGARKRDSVSDVEVEGVPFLTLGARYAFTAGRVPVEFRVQGYNLLDHEGYYATPGGPLVAVFPISWRAEMTARF